MTAAPRFSRHYIYLSFSRDGENTSRVPNHTLLLTCTFCEGMLLRHRQCQIVPCCLTGCDSKVSPPPNRLLLTLLQWQTAEGWLMKKRHKWPFHPKRRKPTVKLYCLIKMSLKAQSRWTSSKLLMWFSLLLLRCCPTKLISYRINVTSRLPEFPDSIQFKHSMSIGNKAV